MNNQEKENQTNISTESESSEDSELDLNILDDVGIKFYPEPYKTIGEFMLYTIVGASTNYIANLRLGRRTNINNMIDNYIKYCKNVETDVYISGMKNKLNLTNNKTDNEKFQKILENIIDSIKKIIDTITKNSHTKYEQFISVSESELKIEAFLELIMADVIPEIKLSELLKLDLLKFLD